MKVGFRASLILVALLLPALSWSKGATTMIIVEGVSLSSTVEISDADIVSIFDVWNGPGVRVNGQATYLNPENLERSFVDWSQGPTIGSPEPTDRFDVTFVVEERPAPRNRYVVTYQFDPLVPGGYIHLPKSTANTGLILHGVEGNWFHSSQSFERLIRPIIEDAMVRDGL